LRTGKSTVWKTNTPASGIPGSGSRSSLWVGHSDDYDLQTPTKMRAWSDARRYLTQINAGGKVIVQLKNWRLGRIGTLLSKKIEDGEWNPSVPPQGGDLGEMGRRVHVRRV
jgi:hypothetical protein